MATTKVVNILSSAVATLIFAYHAYHGVVHYKLGIIVGVTMFLHAVIRGHIAIWLGGALAPMHLSSRRHLAVFELAAKKLFAFVPR